MPMKERGVQKVYMAMSGGVDSSVGAALLKEAGYDVTGVFIKGWHPDFLPCTWREERQDAMRVAATLGIRFTTLDLEKEYERDVVEYLISEYKAGRTPNPDVMCNKHIKFGAFYAWARSEGADAIATGHYARITSTNPNEKSQMPKYQLLQGVDENKDQSYFLWTVSEDILKHTLFPVGGYQKTEVRKLAEKFNLPVAEKKDSQGVCFLGAISMSEFLHRYLDVTSGDVVDTDGTVIGSHEGAALYTIGQRHGFLVAAQSPTDTPRYVAAKDLSANTLVVTQEAPPASERVVLADIHWISGVPQEERMYARIRHRGQLEPCTLTHNEGSVNVQFETPVASLASGQSCVFYGEDGTCYGGGVINEVIY